MCDNNCKLCPLNNGVCSFCSFVVVTSILLLITIGLATLLAMGHPNIVDTGFRFMGIVIIICLLGLTPLLLHDIYTGLQYLLKKYNNSTNKVIMFIKYRILHKEKW